MSTPLSGHRADERAKGDGEIFHGPEQRQPGGAETERQE
jgi:hypothetical protein